MTTPNEPLPTSPYTLYPSDNPGTLITPVLIKDNNYSEWATELFNSLQAKQKIGFIDGTLTKPTTQPDLGRWTAANSMIVGWIRTSIDPKIRSTVTHVGDAHKLWESVRVRFSVKSGVRRHLLEDSITNCKQNGQYVLDYFGRLSKLWEELQNLQTAPICTCAAATDFDKQREDSRVHRFLFGLDDSRFGSLRSQIINEDPFPQSSFRGSSSSQRGRGGGRNITTSRGWGRAHALRAVNEPQALPTNDQVAALISLLQNQQPSLSTDRVSGKAKLTDVILDTGTSHHMTGDKSLLQELKPVYSSDGTFPDGRVSRATHVGKLALNYDLMLTDMLYIPSFNTTLISVNKLVKQTGCIAIFTDTICVLQDRFTKTLIGAGEEREGVYYFTGITMARANVVDAVKLTPTALWHRRLGHLSTKVLASLPFFHNVTVDFDHSAKQTRDIFHESINKASVPFALIHCDVWSPYRTVSSCGASYFLTIVDDYSRAVWVFLMFEQIRGQRTDPELLRYGHTSI